MKNQVQEHEGGKSKPRNTAVCENLTSFVVNTTIKQSTRKHQHEPLLTKSRIHQT